MTAKGSASIVNITHCDCLCRMPGTSAYGATEAALSSLTRTWAAEFNPAGVPVNSLSPGAGPTPS
jgi:NAD(P)-dependent dehydrogenase (short-subunit alcohol dehydrogenase family)